MQAQASKELKIQNFQLPICNPSQPERFAIAVKLDLIKTSFAIQGP
jgi:hypothetical protein